MEQGDTFAVASVRALALPGDQRRGSLAVQRQHQQLAVTDPPAGDTRVDPVLTAAAAAVQPLLTTSFASSFAGLELRHDVPMMVIYRKPDPRLDAEVARVAPDVRTEFRDAKHTLAEMETAGGRVMDDRDYWKDRGMTVSAVAPKVDGSGVEVTTVDRAGDFAGALHERYPDMSFSLRNGGEIVPPVYTGTLPVYPWPPPTARK